MAKVDFITVDTLKANSIISENVDEKLLIPTLRTVQDLYLQPILGTVMYEDFKTKITAASLSLTEKALIVDYMHDIITYYVLMLSGVPMKYKYMNKGVMVKSGADSVSADTADLKVVKDHWRSIAEGYGNILTKHLAQNTATYTLYLSTSLTGVSAETASYQTGWAL